MNSLRTLYPFVRPYWRKSAIALVLLTSLVFMDLAIPRLLQRLIDQGINKQDGAVVLQTSIIMLVISAISAVFAVGNNYFSVQVGEGVARDVREALFLKIQSFSYGNLDRFTTGKLLVRLTSDASAVQRLVQISLRIGTRAPLLMIGSLILMFVTDAHLALMILPLLLLTGVIIVIFSMQMEPRYRTVQRKLDALNTVLQENIAGARLVKAFVRGDHEAARFGTANQEFADRTIQVTQFMSVMGPMLTIFVNIGMVMVIYIGGMQAIAGNLSDGQIVAFTNYLLTTMGPLLMMTLLSNVWAAGFASTRRIEGVLEAEPDVQDAVDPLPLPPALHGRVVFEHVSFAYAPGEGDNARDEDGAPETVLEDINVTIEPGTRVAILGATGAGKTSLVNLIPRFYDASGGCVLIDGVDVRELDQTELRRQIAIVPQEAILFSGSVRDNIRYGHPQASDEEVVAAAKAAQAHDFVMRLPRAVRHARRRAWGEPVRRAEAAARDRPRPARAAAHPDPGRQHERGGCGDRDTYPDGAGRVDGAAHDYRRGPAHQHGADGRQDPGARPRAPCRRGLACRADGDQPDLPRNLRLAAGQRVHAGLCAAGQRGGGRPNPVTIPAAIPASVPADAEGSH